MKSNIQEIRQIAPVAFVPRFVPLPASREVEGTQTQSARPMLAHGVQCIEQAIEMLGAAPSCDISEFVARLQDALHQLP